MMENKKISELKTMDGNSIAPVITKPNKDTVQSHYERAKTLVQQILKDTDSNENK